VPFDPLSFLSGGGLPGFTGGDSGPALSESGGSDVNASANIGGAFIIGGGNQLAGAGAPGGAAGGFGSLTSSNLVFIVGIGAVAWLILTLRRR